MREGQRDSLSVLQRGPRNAGHPFAGIVSTRLSASRAEINVAHYTRWELRGRQKLEVGDGSKERRTFGGARKGEPSISDFPR
jgi:hypothetical protein